MERPSKVPSLLIEMVSAFAASKVSSRVAVVWTVANLVIAAAGLAIAIFALVR